MQILVATERGETSFYKRMPRSYNTTDKLHTSCEISGAPELVTESPVTLVFASPSVWRRGWWRGEGWKWQKGGTDPLAPSGRIWGWRQCTSSCLLRLKRSRVFLWPWIPKTLLHFGLRRVIPTFGAGWGYFHNSGYGKQIS